LDDVLREKSDDQSYLHAEFLKECLTEKANVPTELAISLLEGKINEGIEKGKKWSLVHGFPQNRRELLQFEEKVSMTHMNRTLLTSTGAKKELHFASEVLSRGNTPAYRKAGTFLKWSRRQVRCCEEDSRLSRWDRRCRGSLKSRGLFQGGK